MPTALELTREGWQSYLDSASRIQTGDGVAAANEPVRVRLIARARRAADLLRVRFGVSRAILFGSLTEPDWFSPESDVDLAVEGLDPEAYWDAWRLVESVIETRPVDLVELESASESLRRVIERDGLEL